MTDHKDTSVLIVDDNQKIRSLIITILKSADYVDIEQAENGKMACEMLDNKKYDLILTDWMMPEMDGLELLQHIRNRTDEIKDIPVMIITASDRPDDIVAAAKWKVNGYIVKPFKVATVLAKIDQVLNLHNAKQAKGA